MDAKAFGAFLAKTRKDRGLTQNALAEQLHVTDKAVSRWERGLGFPDINTLEPLADALGLTLAQLMHADSGTGEDAGQPLEDFFLPDDTGPYSVDICCQRHLLADHGTGALDSAGPSPSGRCAVASGKQRCSHTKPDHV